MFFVICCPPNVVCFVNYYFSQIADDDEDYTNGSISPTDQGAPAGRGRGKKVNL